MKLQFSRSFPAPTVPQSPRFQPLSFHTTLPGLGTKSRVVRCLWKTVLLCPYIVPKELDENKAKLHFPALWTAFPPFPWSAKVDRQCGDDPAVELSTLSSHRMAHPGVVSHLCSLFSHPKGCPRCTLREGDLVSSASPRRIQPPLFSLSYRLPIYCSGHIALADFMTVFCGSIALVVRSLVRQY